MAETLAYGYDEWNGLELAGRTVREALAQYRSVFNLPSNANVQVNGQSVGQDYVLQTGDRLECVREAGAKGITIVVS